MYKNRLSDSSSWGNNLVVVGNKGSAGVKNLVTGSVKQTTFTLAVSSVSSSEGMRKIILVSAIRSILYYKGHFT